MTAFETRDGVDIDITLHPDTPAAWRHIPPGTLTALDQLADAIRGTGDWQITVQLGPATLLTATPAPDLGDDDRE